MGRQTALSLSLSVAACACAPAALAVDDGPYTGFSAGGNVAREQNVVQFDDGPMVGIALGYLFSPGLRPELELALRQNDAEDPNDASATRSSDEAAAVMFNHWVDLPGPPFARKLRPYFGVGGGRGTLERTDVAGGGSGDSADVWAYQAGAGIGYDLTRRTVLSVGWRYFATETPDFQGGGPVSRYRSDAVLATVRYGFGRQRMRMVEAGPSQQPAPQAEVAAFETVILRPVNFQFDKSDLTEPAQETLKELIARFNAHPDLRVTIEGHADAIGSNEYNVALSERRALAVVDFLVASGVKRDNLEIRALGENAPVESNATVDGRATNRRAAFVSSEAPPPRVRIVIEPPTEESIEAAKPGDPIAER
jgi:outer membrane protein OmpA-like peptidoglycan-associated protein